MMNDNRLQHIQSLQFRDRPAAESLLVEFVREVFPNLGVAAAELRPLAVSLNSFNGILTLEDGRRLFFKTHVEPGSVIGEYYNASLLAEAGYPVIRPVYASTDYGRQLLIYDVIDAPSAFDMARALDRMERGDLPALTAAQNQCDDALLQIYLKTLDWQEAQQAGEAPVHQLFYHRLGVRYQQFYAGQDFRLPDAEIGWETLLEREWEINGLRFVGTLGQAIERARRELQPEQAGWSVVGHGDAHNGNLFFTPNGLVYFDPAFAGRHHPLLDLTKPLFHNVFATWMYHPREVAAGLKITWHDDGTTIRVEHNYRLSPARKMFFRSKIERVITPLVAELHRRDAARSGGGAEQAPGAWQSVLKSALMCCPLLTMNLADRDRFPPEIGLLGLCYAVQMGLESAAETRSPFDGHLDAITYQIRSKDTRRE